MASKHCPSSWPCRLCNCWRAICISLPKEWKKVWLISNCLFLCLSFVVIVIHALKWFFCIWWAVTWLALSHLKKATHSHPNGLCLAMRRDGLMKFVFGCQVSVAVKNKFLGFEVKQPEKCLPIQHSLCKSQQLCAVTLPWVLEDNLDVLLTSTLWRHVTPTTSALWSARWSSRGGGCFPLLKAELRMLGCWVLVSNVQKHFARRNWRKQEKVRTSVSV